MIPTLTKKRQASPANIDKKLTDAIGELRALDSRFSEIRTELQRKCDWSSFEARVKAATTEYAQHPTPENLEKLVMAEFVLERVQARLVHLRRSVMYGGDAGAHQFASECPDWRVKLSTACGLKIEKAKLDLENVTALEREHLGDGFDAEDVQSSPVVRRAALAVKQWENLFATIANSPVETIWRSSASAILNQ